MHRILVVDDECLIANTLGLIFRKQGFEVRVSYSADDALQCARSFSPHLLLCDIGMPGRSGLELVDDFDRELPECQVILLTGDYANLVHAREQSAWLRRPARVLTKPCNPCDLLREAGLLLAAA